MGRTRHRNLNPYPISLTDKSIKPLAPKHYVGALTIEFAFKRLKIDITQILSSMMVTIVNILINRGVFLFTFVYLFSHAFTERSGFVCTPSANERHSSKVLPYDAVQMNHSHAVIVNKNIRNRVINVNMNTGTLTCPEIIIT